MPSFVSPLACGRAGALPWSAAADAVRVAQHPPSPRPACRSPRYWHLCAAPVSLPMRRCAPVRSPQWRGTRETIVVRCGEERETEPLRPGCFHRHRAFLRRDGRRSPAECACGGVGTARSSRRKASQAPRPAALIPASGGGSPRRMKAWMIDQCALSLRQGGIFLGRGEIRCVRDPPRRGVRDRRPRSCVR